MGTVHKEEEDEMNADDRDFILDILNYMMKDIFASLGFDVEGGEFVYAKKDKVDPEKHIDIVQKLSAMGLPMDDDYLYETFSVAKPKDYKEIKARKEQEREAVRQSLQNIPDEHKTPFKQRLNSFFGLAPQSHGANTDF